MGLFPHLVRGTRASLKKELQRSPLPHRGANHLSGLLASLQKIGLGNSAIAPRKSVGICIIFLDVGSERSEVGPWAYGVANATP